MISSLSGEVEVVDLDKDDIVTAVPDLTRIILIEVVASSTSSSFKGDEGGGVGSVTRREYTGLAFVGVLSTSTSLPSSSFNMSSGSGEDAVSNDVAVVTDGDGDGNREARREGKG